MKNQIYCLLCFLSLVAAGCGHIPTQLRWYPDENNPLAFFSVSCDASDDLWDQKALQLKIANPSDRRLDDVTITFNNSYTTAMQNLRLYLGIMKGSPAFGRSTLLPGDNLRFSFSHDTPNQAIMTNQVGERMPYTLVPTSITIRSEDTVGTWRVTEPTPNRPDAGDGN